MGKFLASKFSGYIALASVGILLALVWYIYNEGKSACRNSVANKTIVSNQSSRSDSHEVSKKIQSLDEVGLNSKLCSLGIVRRNGGC